MGLSTPTKHKITYHIVTDLENRFTSIYEVMQTYCKGKIIRPQVPKSAMPNEDKEIPRICVAPTLEQCVDALHITGIFRRCCSSYEDGMSYVVNGLEVYPIIILTFDELDYVVPSPEQVPDVLETGELWITHDAVPINVELKWVNHLSLKVYESTCNRNQTTLKCSAIDFVEPNKQSIHPWLTGTGNILDSSNEEYLSGDLPYEVCRGITNTLAKAGIQNIKCNNYHAVIMFNEECTYIRRINKVLELYLDKGHSIKIVEWSDRIPNEAKREIIDILSNYASRETGEMVIYNCAKNI